MASRDFGLGFRTREALDFGALEYWRFWSRISHAILSRVSFNAVIHPLRCGASVETCVAALIFCRSSQRGSSGLWVLSFRWPILFHDRTTTASISISDKK
ncbi:unnamed protein product [Cuscuta campestris]|uniref:Uncharacterized protein n=1 Tax=Cuscuta campestris TaxID=132261 RepID=A0A484N412_9ASTE|nr:unnamed protein product [Cuscuta campestris]